jgi:Flp pilus assembly protein TadD
MRILNQANWGLGLAMGLAMLAQGVAAQPATTTDVQTTQSADPSDRLAANLVILSQNPRDVTALTEAGLSAIAVGDGDAALAFLARAEDISPGSAKIKAAIGSALVLKQKPTDALRLFGEAVALGMPEQVVARDRGLAYDLRGEPKRAQHDYALAMRSGADDDLTIRYALSLGISGDDQSAMELLDPLLRQKNRSAWRARAFVLAMNGDVEAAQDVANSVMPGGAGASMAPFLKRLATLNSAERALAVNYGIMPSDGSALAVAAAGDIYRPSGSGGASDGLIPAGDPLGPRPSDVVAAKPAVVASKEPRRIPGRESVTLVPVREESKPASPAPRATTGPVVATVAADRPAMAPRPSMGPPSVATVEKAPQAAGPAVTSPPSSSSAQSSNATSAGTEKPDDSPAPRFEVPDTPAPAPAISATREIVTQAAPAASPVASTPGTSAGLGAILAGIEVEQESVAGPLPSAAELKAARLAAQRKAAAEAKADAEAKAAKEAKEAERLAAAKNPARIWVQIATGANDAGLPGTWKKMKEKSPAVFKGQSASSVPFKATNRLLVGPFKSQAEARAMVNAMNKAGLQGSTFSSDPGQVVTKVSGK